MKTIQEREESLRQWQKTFSKPKTYYRRMISRIFFWASRPLVSRIKRLERENEEIRRGSKMVYEVLGRDRLIEWVKTGSI